MRGYGTIDIFWEQELSEYLDALRAEMKQAVHAETAQYLLNASEDEYAKHLLNRFSVEPLRVDFDSITVSTREENIPSEQFPGQFSVAPGKSYPKQVIRYHIPYQGTEELLRCRPNRRLHTTHSVELKGSCICFDIVDFYGNADRVKQDANQIIDRIRQQAQNVDQNVAEYNKNLLSQVTQVITERKKQLQDRIGIVASLGVPIRKSTNVPETFRVPVARKRIVPKPSVPSGAGLPEPALGKDVYQGILQVIHDTGRVFERLPSTYADKEEEALRDHLIMILEPHFEGSTTGETFNKSGKTDILMRHEKSNIFVAECQWWDGPKQHLEKIDQLLGYLTWRDSKTAVVCFVGRKDFTNALRQIEEATKQHPCYVRRIDAKEETWLNFEFHLPGDPDRKVKMAVLAFHMPRG